MTCTESTLEAFASGMPRCPICFTQLIKKKKAIHRHIERYWECEHCGKRIKISEV